MTHRPAPGASRRWPQCPRLPQQLLRVTGSRPDGSPPSVSEQPSPDLRLGCPASLSATGRVGNAAAGDAAGPRPSATRHSVLSCPGRARLPSAGLCGLERCAVHPVHTRTASQAYRLQPTDVHSPPPPHKPTAALAARYVRATSMPHRVVPVAPPQTAYGRPVLAPTPRSEEPTAWPRRPPESVRRRRADAAARRPGPSSSGPQPGNPSLWTLAWPAGGGVSPSSGHPSRHRTAALGPRPAPSSRITARAYARSYAVICRCLRSRRPVAWSQLAPARAPRLGGVPGRFTA